MTGTWPIVSAEYARAREAIARCLADVEDYPGQEHYALADDVLLALDNAGVALTDPGYADCAEVADRRGKRWSYSEPADVWNLRLDDGTISHTSARSWRRLNAEFGLLTSTASCEHRHGSE